MDRKEYHELLNDKRWKVRRLEFLETKGNKCETCGSTTQLQVHHKRYDEKAPWEYPDEDMEVKCRKCHKEHHREHGITLVKHFIASDKKIDFDSYKGNNVSGKMHTSYISSKGITLDIKNDLYNDNGNDIGSNLENLFINLYEFADLQKSGDVKVEAKSIVGNISCSIYFTAYFKTVTDYEKRNVNLLSKIEIDSNNAIEYEKAKEAALERARIAAEKRKASYEKRLATIARNKALKEAQQLNN